MNTLAGIIEPCIESGTDNLGLAHFTGVSWAVRSTTPASINRIVKLVMRPRISASSEMPLIRPFEPEVTLAPRTATQYDPA